MSERTSGTPPAGLPAGRFHGVLRKSFDIDLGRLSETTYRRGHSQSPHMHDLPHISLIVDGAYEETIGGRSQPVGAGALTYYHAGQVHHEQHFAKGTHFLLELQPARGSYGETLMPLFAAASRSPHPAGPLAWRLYQEFKLPDRFSPLSIQALSLELFVESLRTRSRPSETRRPAWLSSVEELLRSRLSNPPSLSELARQVGVHPVHLARTFREFERVTVGDRLRSLRVDFAKRRLAADDAPLAQIALDAGFSDQAHFARVFKRLTGVTPSRYRSLVRR